MFLPLFSPMILLEKDAIIERQIGGVFSFGFNFEMNRRRQMSL
ncbi:MAG: hypothetical protein OEM32_11035 [Acidimicrobiia bacterium]|nr:hypothetical protein [Acidimicrobiia bacterium]